MAINVTCPNCMKRFTVGDQFAGKEGPCPKCKGKITIPKLEEAVVIHAPKPEGPTDAKGRSILKTTRFKDAKFSPVVAAVSAVGVLGSMLVAFFLRGSAAANSYPLLGGGAIFLGPLLAWSGYNFLRDSELEPFRGQSLWLRAGIVGAIFAVCWFVYSLLASQLNPDYATSGMEIYQVMIAAGAAVGIATFAATIGLEIEPLMGFFSAALFFAATVGLRLIMALPALPGMIFQAVSGEIPSGGGGGGFGQ
jgi:hypothetical protein